MSRSGEGDRGERWRTENTSSKTSWAFWLVGFGSPAVYQTYLRRTGGICAPESARGRLNPAFVFVLVGDGKLTNRVNMYTFSA